MSKKETWMAKFSRMEAAAGKALEALFEALPALRRQKPGESLELPTHPFLEWLELYGPGKFLGDIALVLSGSELARVEALDRLASRYFRREAVIYEARWYGRGLDRQFYEFRGGRDGQSFQEAWKDLVQGAIVQVVNEFMAKEDPADWRSLYGEMRTAVGRETEKYLGDGWTADKRENRPSFSMEPNEEGDDPEIIIRRSLEAENEALHELQQFEKHVRQRRAWVMANLTPEERQSLTQKGGAAAERKRRERARKKLKEFLRGMSQNE